jgi:DNA-directed RNA polymerase specialized sigma24 family protein
MLAWLEKVQAGDDRAQQAIWERYFPELLEVARRRLPTSPGAVDDEEDVALSALESFFQAAQRGRFPDLRDRESLWRLLSEMTRRKVIDRIRRHLALRQGAGQLHGGSAIMADTSGVQPRLADAGLPPPDVELILREQIHQFLGALREKDPRLEELALAKMEGHTNEELAGRFGRSLPTIERWLQRIRKIGQRIFDA